MAVVPNTEAITTGPGATSEAGGGAPDEDHEPATPGSDLAPRPEAAPPATRSRLPHVRALDGLRGLAVLGVLVYHLDLGWLPGGFLGVSLFFTLSGFLITSLVLAERSDTGGIAMGRFWGRRFRRLLPAAMAGVALAVLFAAFAGDADQLRRLPGDVWAAIAYVANWRFLFAGDSYAAGYQAPSPLLHYWSLAIEEQFYVFFPIVVAGLIAWKASKRIWFAVMGTLLAGSMVATIVFFDANETTRVYFSSLTRMAEILAGVLLALVLEGWWRAAHPTGAEAVPDAGTDPATTAAPASPDAPPATVVAANGAAATSVVKPASQAGIQAVSRATLERLANEPAGDGVPLDPDQPGTSSVAANGSGAHAAPEATVETRPDLARWAEGGAAPAADTDTDTAVEADADTTVAADAHPGLMRRSPIPTLADGRPRIAVTVASAVAALVALGLWARVTTADEWIYRGGLWFVAAVSCVLVLGAITAGPVASALSWRPLVFMGAISYGIYVYHWPLFQWLSPQRVGFDGIPLAILRVAVTFAVALASYRWLERPIREGRVKLTWGTGLAAMAAVLVVGVVAVNLGTQADARAVQIALDADSTPVVTRPPIASPNTTGSTEPGTGAGTTVAAAPIPPPESVLFIGDSLLHQAFPVISSRFAEQDIETTAIGGPGTSLLFDQSRWLGELETALTESQPDVVVIESCCGYDDRREPYTLLGVPLEPDTDATWLVWQHVADEAVDMATEHGALVLWVLAPPAQTSGYYGPIEGRIDRANAIALDLPTRHPCLGFVDWRVIAAPDGSYTDTLPGLDGEPVQVRAGDGLHFTPPGMNVLAEVSESSVLTDWERSPRTCGPDRRSE